MMSPYRPPAGPVQCLYVDEHIVVAVKPSGLLSVPGRGPEKADCLPARLEGAFGPLLIVHRLDMETSGLIVLARTPEAQSALSRAFAERKVEKRYVAGVSGAVEAESGTISEPIGPDWPNRPRQKLDPENGKPSESHFRVLNREAEVTYMLLTPVTGRSHQLRLHMLALGHPILGDQLYGPPETRNAAPRLLLHASSLSFDHPVTGEQMSWSAPAPF